MSSTSMQTRRTQGRRRSGRRGTFFTWPVALLSTGVFLAILATNPSSRWKQDPPDADNATPSIFLPRSESNATVDSFTAGDSKELNASSISSRNEEQPTFVKGPVEVPSWLSGRVSTDLPDESDTLEVFYRGIITAKNEKLAVHSPLCIRSTGLPSTSDIFVPRIDSSANLTDCFMGSRRSQLASCSSASDGAWQDGDWRLDSVPQKVPETWFLEERKRDSCMWFPGVTLLFRSQSSWMNIAHFTGRIMFAYHFLASSSAYGETKSVNRVILELLPTHLLAHADPNSFHYGMLKLIFSPLDVVLVNSDTPLDTRPAIYLIQSGYLGKEKSACFETAVIPAFLKGRFFLNDKEVPDADISSAEKSNEPTSASEFKARVARHLSIPLVPKQPRFIYLSRAMRREFSVDSEKRVTALFKEICAENNFEYVKVDFVGMPFQDQVAIVANASVAIGIHGANLVNAMFLTTPALLVEIFPYGHDHDMFIGAGNSGVNYVSYGISEGAEFPNLTQFTDSVACRRTNAACKDWYRSDKRQVLVPDRDIALLGVLLRKEIASLLADT